MIQLMKLPVQRGNAPLRIAKGHFVTNHSHINYYIDITFQKTRISEAKASAYQLVSNFINDTPVDTIVCLDGTAVLGACVAEIRACRVRRGSECTSTSKCVCRATSQRSRSCLTRERGKENPGRRG